MASLPELCSSSRAWGFDTGSLYVDPSDMTPLSGKIIAGCGGWAPIPPPPNANLYAYTVATNTWETFPPFLTARRDMAGEFLPLASAPALWVWGGYDGTSVNTTTVEYYSLELDSGGAAELHHRIADHAAPTTRAPAPAGALCFPTH
ncbi:MAG: hypothetical protein EHM57_08150 [Actinobacteria bacterium]|nr:MAG: hypothetical protein EHM57_08150 [Actinomycetota bacterium]